MPQFCLLFYAILQSMAQWPPLNTPLGGTTAPAPLLSECDVFLTSSAYQ